MLSGEIITAVENNVFYHHIMTILKSLICFSIIKLSYVHFSASHFLCTSQPEISKLKFAIFCSICSWHRSMDEERFQQVWSQLETAINGIQKKRNSNDMSYVELYRNAYEVVVCQRSSTVYGKVKETIVKHLVNNVSQKSLE
jgi:Cullin family